MEQGKAAATGVAAINSIGSIGGFIGPYLLGALQVSLLSEPLGECLHRQAHHHAVGYGHAQ